MKNLFHPLIIAATVLLCSGPQFSRAATPTETFLFQTVRKPGTLDHVVVQLEVGGEVKQREHVGAKIESIPLSGICEVVYDEKTLEIPTSLAGRWRSIRAYEKAAAVIKRGNKEDVEGDKPSLRPQRSLIAVQIDAQAATVFSPRGSLTRDELEVTDVLANSLLLEQFLPGKPAAVGQSWKHGEKLIGMFLGLDEVGKCDVQSTLKEVTDTVARFEVSGTVEGTRHDVATKIELKGKYRFDRRLKRIDWFGLVVKEQKVIGQVEGGLDALAKVQVRITPQQDCPTLSDAALKGLSLQTDANLTQLEYQPRAGGWQLLHDRRWHLTGDRSDLAVLRLVDRGEYVTQCTVSAPPPRRPEKLLSLAEFKEDVRQALAKSFGEFVEAKELSGTGDRRVYKVVVKGEPNDVPVQWNYYSVADPQGRLVTLVFATEQKLVDRLADNDEKFVAGIRFVEQKTVAKELKPESRAKD